MERNGEWEQDSRNEGGSSTSLSISFGTVPLKPQLCFTYTNINN